MSHHPGSESDQNDPRKSITEASLVKDLGGNANFWNCNIQVGAGNIEQSSTGSPTTAGSPAPKRKSDTSETDDGIVQISDDIFMNTKKPLRKGMNVYEGYQEHVGGQRLPLAIKAIAPFPENSKREVDILVNIALHPNVVQIIKSKEQHTSLPTLYIAMELCSPLTLHDYLKEKREKNSPLDFKKAMSYSKGLIRGMKHIHDNRIVHGDLKPQNIVFSLKGDQIKVTDFGISKQLQEFCSVTDMTGEGTDGYRAPETYISRRTSLMADIYSLGITLYSIFTNGKHPFGEDSDLWKSNIKKDKDRDLSGLPEEIRHERDEFLNLLGNMLESDPKKRPTMEEISDHAFFSDNQAITAQVSTKLEGTNYDQPSTSHHPNVMKQTPTGAIRSVIADPDEDYHCPESAASPTPPTAEEPSDIADEYKLLEPVKKIQPRDEAAAAKNRQRVEVINTTFAAGPDVKTMIRNGAKARVADLDGVDHSNYWVPHSDMTAQDVYEVRNHGSSRALILNNIEFTDQRMMKRRGTDMDCILMEKLCRNLGFEMRRENNKTAEEMKELLREFAKSSENMKADMVVVYIGSHGERDEHGDDTFFGVDGGRVKFSDVRDMFTRQSSPLLSNKPKIFFLQFCRQDSGRIHEAPAAPFQTARYVGSDLTGFAPAAPFQTTSYVGSDAAPPDEVKTEIDPDADRQMHAMDMLCVYSTLAGMKSYRDTQDGSWFVTALVRIFSDHAHRDDLLSMLTKVNNSVSANEGMENDSPAFQICEVVHSLRRKIFFYPGR